jgi:vitamin K-dependent gamma-carboxylase
MMVLLPCNVCYSIDQYLFPKIHSDTCPKYVSHRTTPLYRVLVVLTCDAAALGGLVGGAWLLSKDCSWLYTPMQRLPRSTKIGCEPIPYKFFPLLETFIYRESVAYALSYGGLVYDLAVGPMLLFRRTFWLAVAMTMFFHISNKLLFNIGIFPIFMIASTSFFFDPSWPRILIAMLRRLVNLPVHSLPKLGASWRDTKPRSLTCKNWLVLFGISAFLLLMVLIPLRCYTYPGTTAWHEYGHKFSWRMKLRTKQVHVSEPSFNCMHMLSLSDSLTHSLAIAVLCRLVCLPTLLDQVPACIPGTS